MPVISKIKAMPVHFGFMPPKGRYAAAAIAESAMGAANPTVREIQPER